jgi:hypothetical protein
MLVVAIAACQSTWSVDAPESADLTPTDIAIFRVSLVSVIAPRLSAVAPEHSERAVVVSPTSVMPVWPERSRSGPVPPPQFQPGKTSPPPSEYVPAVVLSPAERSSWESRNRREHAIPDLGVPGFQVASNGTTAQFLVHLSAPAYPTPSTAILVAAVRRGGYSEGWLVRVTSASGSWRVTDRVMLWIS